MCSDWQADVMGNPGRHRNDLWPAPVACRVHRGALVERGDICHRHLAASLQHDNAIAPEASEGAADRFHCQAEVIGDVAAGHGQPKGAAVTKVRDQAPADVQYEVGDTLLCVFVKERE